MLAGLQFSHFWGSALLLMLFSQPVRAGLNLNFRSQQLSNIFGAKKSSEVPPKQEEAKKESPDFLRLDLSGRLQTLLAGQEKETTTRIIRPLLPLEHSSNPLTPRQVNLAVDYDFAQSSFGVLRIVPEYILDLPNNNNPTNLYQPRQLDLAIEKGIANWIQNALEARLWWNPWHRRQYYSEPEASPLVRVRCEHGGLALLSGVAPVHPRLSFEGTLSKNMWGARTKLAVPDATTAQQDWWLPGFFINTLGVMQANKQIWLGTEAPRLGFRLAVRRQLEWSVLNSPVEQQDAKTYLSLQIEGAGTHWRTGARFESTMEEPLEQARLTLSSHWHINRETKDP